MPLYDYKVKDSKGNTRTGQLEANDERHAAAMIREAGGLPMEIRAASQQAGPSQSGSPRSPFMLHIVDPLWTGVNMRHLVFFFRQLAVLLNAGMSLSEALRSVGGRSRGSIGRIVGEMAQRVQSGGRMSETMEGYPRVFSSLCLSMTRAGETSGLMASMADRIASNLEYELSIRRRLAKVILYPCIVLVMAFMLLIFLGFMPKWVIPAIPWIIIGIVALKIVTQFEGFRLVWDSIKVQPPILGTMARKVAMSRFCRAIADLYAAGTPISAAMEVSADACANVAIGRAIRGVIPSVRNGESLSSALSRTRVILPVVMEMLMTGEKTGSYELVLTKVADYMDEEVDATIYKVGIAVFILTMLVAAAVVLCIAVQFYGSYFNGLLGGTQG